MLDPKLGRTVRSKCGRIKPPDIGKKTDDLKRLHCFGVPQIVALRLCNLAKLLLTANSTVQASAVLWEREPKS
jgi:hypothetical protein